MFFEKMEEAPPDPIFGLLGAFQADPRKDKVNLLIGIYKDEHLLAKLLPSVKKAEAFVAEQEVGADYLPIDGSAELTEKLGRVVFGSDWEPERMYGAHVCGGTGALRAGFELICQQIGQTCFVSNHTWPNHHSVLERAGFKVEKYPYYNPEKKGLDFEAMIGCLSRVPEKTPVLLHACCHNPTGCDLSLDQWSQLSQLMKKRHLLPFFDFAYQGFGDGVEKDAASIRTFVKEGHELFVAYSCSKNFSLYSERVGALFVVSQKAEEKKRIASQAKRIIRALYSNPPSYGARVVLEVFRHEDLRAEWEKDLHHIRKRLTKTRQALIERLSESGKNFDYLKNHKGMFSFIDLKKEQVQKMIDQFGIYLTGNGRVSIAGLNSSNIDFVAKAILSVGKA